MAAALAIMMTTAWAGNVEMWSAAPLAELSRLARGRVTPTPVDSPATTVQRTRLAALMQWLVRADTRLKRGPVRPADVYNLISVVRDTVDAGALLGSWPEEALCWHRAGIDLAEAYLRYLSCMAPETNVLPAHIDNPARYVQNLQSRYEMILERCVLR
jgi:hypothetical protein